MLSTINMIVVVDDELDGRFINTCMRAVGCSVTTLYADNFMFISLVAQNYLPS